MKSKTILKKIPLIVFSWKSQKMSLLLSFEGKKVLYIAILLTMNKITLDIKDLLYSQTQSGAYVLILGDRHSMRRLPIVIGGNEAQSIALGLEELKNTRPLTHDLFKKFADNYGVELMEVVINRFRDGVFYAMLVCRQGDEISMIDARPSDAIALAVRFHCPISAYETVMDEAAIEMEDLKDMEEEDTTADTPAAKPEPEELSLEQLQKLLQIAIEEEDYQKAAELRDIIKGKS